MDKGMLVQKTRNVRPFGQYRDNRKAQSKIMEEIIHIMGEARFLCDAINETASDVSLWRSAKKQVSVRASVNIALLFKIDPSLLRPDIFPKHTKITIGE